MVRGGDAAHELGVIIMQVTFVNEHIDHRFIRVVEIATMSPALATVNLDVDLCEPFKRFASRYENCNLGKPSHVAAGFIELATATRGPEELIR